MQPNSRARRALPLIACAAVAALVAGVFYLRQSSPPARPVPAAEPTSVLVGPYAVDYAFSGPVVGWALATWDGYEGSGFRVFKTTDGAAHWREVYGGTVGGFQAYIHFFDQRRGVFMAARSMYRTVDGGETWALVDTQDPTGYVSFESATRGWTTSFDGDAAHLLRTDDGAGTWTTLPGELPPDLFMATPVSTFRGVEGWLGRSGTRRWST